MVRANKVGTGLPDGRRAGQMEGPGAYPRAAEKVGGHPSASQHRRSSGSPRCPMVDLVTLEVSAPKFPPQKVSYISF